MIINAGLVIDFGNSETRVTLSHGDSIIDTFIMSNQFALVPPEDNKLLNNHADGLSTVFKYGDELYANGKIVQTEYKGKVSKPNGKQNKHMQLVTLLSLNLAYINAYRKLAEVLGTTVEELDVSFRVAVLMPPSQAFSADEAMEAYVKTVTDIECVIPITLKKRVNIIEASVLSESAAAFFGVCFEYRNNDVETLEQNMKYLDGYVMVLDIGAGTTDVAVMCDAELVQANSITIKRGGNDIVAFARRHFEDREGYSLTADVAESLVRTGYVKDGAAEVDCTDILRKSKVDVAMRMVDDIRSGFTTMNISLRDIHGLLVCGGGALASMKDGVETTESLSKFILEIIKEEYMPNVNLIDTGDKNLRMLNLNGATLFIMSEKLNN